MKPTHITLIVGLALAGVKGFEVRRSLERDGLNLVQLLRHTRPELHRQQLELLKIDWGQPGLCTEWDRDYNSETQSCGKRGKSIKRKYP